MGRPIGMFLWRGVGRPNPRPFERDMVSGLDATRRLRGGRPPDTLTQDQPSAPLRLAVPLTAAVIVVLSAPFVQQAFTAASDAWGPYFRAVGMAATALPVGAALLLAATRIRDRRPARYSALAISLALATTYVLIDDLSFVEAFHFVEYGLLAWLFHRSRRTLDDGVLILLPLVAGFIVGTLDEWFQWFIPIRVGEARDILLNGVASGCGLLFAIAIDPPAGRVAWRRRESAIRLLVSGGVAATLFALFFVTVHVGHDVHEAEIGAFRSRYTAAALSGLARDRSERWRARPPRLQRRLSREDQYLTEGLWHVQRRNQALSEGDPTEAWRENLILERFYAPILDVPTYANLVGHAWSTEQRREVEAEAGDRVPATSDAYPYPLYVLPVRR